LKQLRAYRNTSVQIDTGEFLIYIYIYIYIYIVIKEYDKGVIYLRLFLIFI